MSHTEGAIDTFVATMTRESKRLSPAPRPTLLKAQSNSTHQPLPRGDEKMEEYFKRRGYSTSPSPHHCEEGAADAVDVIGTAALLAAVKREQGKQDGHRHLPGVPCEEEAEGAALLKALKSEGTRPPHPRHRMDKDTHGWASGAYIPGLTAQAWRCGAHEDGNPLVTRYPAPRLVRAEVGAKGHPGPIDPDASLCPTTKVYTLNGTA